MNLRDFGDKVGAKIDKKIEESVILQDKKLNYLGVAALGAAAVAGGMLVMSSGEHNQAETAVRTAAAAHTPLDTGGVRAELALGNDYENIAKWIGGAAGLTGLAWISGAVSIVYSRRYDNESNLHQTFDDPGISQ